MKHQWLKPESADNGNEVASDGGDATKNNIDNRNDKIQSTMIESENKQPVTQESPTYKNNGGGWKCACEGNGMIFLPQSLMKSFSGPGAAMRMGAGGCYHKQM